MKERFTEEEAHAILNLAVEQAASSGKITRQQLESIAGEIGIATEDLARAEHEWSAMQALEADRLAYRADRRRGFYSHLAGYGLSAGFLFTLNAIVSPDYWWAVFPLLAWGLGLSFHGLCALRESGGEYDRGFALWRARRQLKLRG
ncbi:MAG TPA: 2TM domain-containing protein [Armatimonadota bacterium]|jgi:hypothetical protein